MATMPIIPGLAGAPPPDDGETEAPTDIAALLDAIPDEDLSALEDSAQAAADAGELDEILNAAPADEEAPPEGDEEATETPADEEAETDEEQATEEDEGEEDPIPFRRAAEDSATAAAAGCEELQKLVEAAAEHEGAGVDVDALEALLKDAEEATEEAQKAGEDAHDADATEAAELAETAQKAAELVAQALADAKASVAKDADGAEDKAVPEEVRAMTAWAKQVSGLG
jgi:hypothetical protein